MRIAIIGPFDIENYGDHILKEVLENSIKTVTPKVTFDVFSVFDEMLGFRRDLRVKSIDSLEANHKKYPYDAIIIAGGSVIHYETLLQGLKGETVTYSMWKLWTQASRVASKYGIPLLWNSPEAPLNFEGWEVPVTRHLLKPVDFLSVRNISSQSALMDFTDKEPSISPDPAWILRDVYTDTVIEGLVPTALSDKSRIAVFHCNQRLSKSDMQRVATLLKNLQKRKYSVVLLPLAYTNFEQNTLKELNDAANNEFCYFNKVLSLPETVAILSRCKLYIGLSFHGAITTTVFGGEVVAFDYENRRKTKELYELIGKANNYTTTIDDLEKVVQKLSKKRISKNTPENSTVLQLQEEVRRHFKKMNTTLANSSEKTPLDIDEDYRVAEVEIEKRFKKSREMQELSDAFSQTYDQYQALLTSLHKAE